MDILRLRLPSNLRPNRLASGTLMRRNLYRMTFSMVRPSWTVLILLMGLCLASASEGKQEYTPISTVEFVSSSSEPDVYAVYKDIFRRHLAARAPSARFLPSEDKELNDGASKRHLVVRLGQTDRSDVGPEGFEMTVVRGEHGEWLATIKGGDTRGVLYGLGALLWRTRPNDQGFTLPLSSSTSTPRMRLRSANGSEKQPMDPKSAEKTKARSYTREEGIFYLEEAFLLGANQYNEGWGGSVPIALKDYDPKTGKGVNIWRSELIQKLEMDYVVNCSINGLGRSNIQSEWRAHDQGGLDPTNVCLSIPEARAALLKAKELVFKHYPKLDRIVFAASDVAGCDCEKCSPWVKTYFELSKDLADLLHHYHPEAKVFITNQDFSHADNEWLFNKISQENPSWLGGYCYAPGGSENSTYGGVTINPRWNQFPGLYPKAAFLKSRLQYLHPKNEVIAFTDISHWKRAENGIPATDQVWAEAFHRRSFNARPRAYQQILRSNMAYTDGVLGYSEGNYDDFNKFFLLRLSWNPDQSAEQITREYYDYYCGDSAGELLTEAVFLVEKNHEESTLSRAAEIERAHALTREAEDKIPTVLMKVDWRFAMLAQQTALDLYLLRGEQGRLRAYDDAMIALRGALKADTFENLSEIAKGLQRALEETPEMIKLREEAQRFDDQANRNGAIRNTAMLDLRKIDGVGVRWLLSQINRALRLSDTDAVKATVLSIVNYNVVGSNEFYDDCGVRGAQPHFVEGTGEFYYGTGGWPEDSRPSQRSYLYTQEHQGDLLFHYEGLDRSAKYEVEIIHPNPTAVSFAMNSPNEFQVKANGVVIGHAIPTGSGFDRFKFEIPAEVTKSGRLELAFQKLEHKARSVCISEIWVRKKQSSEEESQSHAPERQIN